jgi:hypothetical protein
MLVDIDEGVGRILKTLEEENILDKIRPSSFLQVITGTCGVSTDRDKNV